MGILLVNAYDAWIDAVKMAWYIHDGVSTLHYKKRFVSSLHNAVELFVKQILIDKNDYRVASIKNPTLNDCKILQNYYNSKDLNVFFNNLSKDDLSRFYSIEFNQLCEMGKQIFSFTAGPALAILKQLRNNETHFYIDSDYLNENEFKELYNFMWDFYLELIKNNLLPWAFGNGSQGVPDEYTDMVFLHQKITHFNYSSAIKRSDVAHMLHDYFHKRAFDGYETKDAIFFTNVIWEDVKEWNCVHSKQILIAYVESLFKYNAIVFRRTDVEFEPGCVMPEYEVDVKILKK